MIRTIIKIDETLCNGCGICVDACHEGAIAMVDGKATLLRDDYCDGLGNCLPVCPTNAISFEKREALAFDEEAVLRKMEEEIVVKQLKREDESVKSNVSSGGCPGSRAVQIEGKSNLRQWPVQIQLVSVNAPYLKNAHLLIAADCTAYAHGDFHQFMNNKVTLIGCPKLDDVDYSNKLAEIIQKNDIQSITVIRMEVPCCGGIVHYVKEALRKSGAIIPWQAITIGIEGEVLED